MRQIRKILVLDESSAAEKTKAILFASDVVGTVDYFVTARMAIRYIEQREFVFPEQLPDLALIEIQLPGDEGFKFLDSYSKLNEELKEKIHLVVLTSCTDEKLVEEAGKNTYVEEVVTKPLTEGKIREIQRKIWEGLKK